MTSATESVRPGGDLQEYRCVRVQGELRKAWKKRTKKLPPAQREARQAAMVAGRRRGSGWMRCRKSRRTPTGRAPEALEDGLFEGASMRQRLPHLLSRLALTCFTIVVYRLPASAADEPASPDAGDAIKLEGPSGQALSFSDDGRRLLSAGKAGIRVWDTRTWKPVGDDFPPHENDAYPPSLGPGGRTLLTSNSERGKRPASEVPGRAQLWDVDGHAVIQQFRLRDAISAAVCSPDGSKVATAGDGRVVAWDVKTGKELFATAYQRSLRSLEFGARGSLLLAIVTEGVWLGKNGHALPERDDLLARGHYAFVWDAATGRLVLAEDVDISAYEEDAPEMVGARPAAVSPDGTRLVSRDFEGWKTLDLATGKIIASQCTHCQETSAHKPPFPIGGAASWVAFSHDGKRFVTVGALAGLVIWESVELDRARSVGGLHAWQAAHFSTDSRRILLTATGRWPLIVNTDTGAVLSPPEPPAGMDLVKVRAAMSPDGSRLAVTDGGGMLTVYTVQEP